MKALAVSHNGQKVAVVGVLKNSMVNVSVMAAFAEIEQLLQDDAYLHLSRAFIGKDRIENWPAPLLAVGDEITIRIVDVEIDDPPPKRVPIKPKQLPDSENQGKDFDFNSRFGRFK